MAVGTKKYAVALYETIKETSGAQLTVALKNFVKILIDKSLLNRADRIISDFKNYYNEQEGIVAVELVTARELSDAETKNFSQQLAAKLGKKVELTSRVDATLTAGAIFRFGDYLVDGSLKQQLAELGERISGHR